MSDGGAGQGQVSFSAAAREKIDDKLNTRKNPMT
jgi:hypothetical protein